MIFLRDCVIGHSRRLLAMTVEARFSLPFTFRFFSLSALPPPGFHPSPPVLPVLPLSPIPPLSSPLLSLSLPLSLFIVHTAIGP